ncbi:MarR family winged helix-turn-helix transcriptional regulator [Leeia aquatica]|uniref:MarR family transcriptional regulator n=1 Tax=Leeia aquatica TaxID=2725557 RepID=A0A847S793_9NEIS|nr:MarR family transcriptional regulator [Leeia aquatica]NLR75623.1 MarR family transcriptional regulator [Leeia aquatica]
MGAVILRELARRYVQSQKQALVEYGVVGQGQCTLLTLLGRQGPLSQQQLGLLSGLEKSWVSRGVDRLVDEGWAERSIPETDKRRCMVTLTPLGQAQFAALEAYLNAHALHVLERVPQAQRAAVEAALQVLYRSLQEELEEQS